MNGHGDSELARLLAEAHSLADAARSAFRPVPEIAEASDPTGAVRVTVEDHGTRVTRVTVTADWKTRIKAEQLGTAVMQAVLSVQLGPVREFFAAMSSSRPTAPPPPPPLPQPQAVSASDQIAKLSWDDLGDALETVHKALDTLAATSVPGPDTGEIGARGRTVGRSGNHRVTVSLAGGQPADVTVDARWAEQVGRQQLSDSLNQAFGAAYAETARASVASTGTAGGDAAAYAGIAAELESAMRRIGIVVPPQPGKDH